MALALALRLSLLGQSSLSTDEGWSAWCAAAPDLESLLHDLRTQDFHPPLHYAALWLTRQAGGESEAALRLPSALAGTLACGLGYLLGREVGGPRLALLAGLLAAFSASGVYHSQEARMYGFAMAFATAAGLFWLRALRTGSTASALAAGLCLWLGVLSQYQAGLLLLLALPAAVRRPGLAAALLAPGLLAVPWLPAFVQQAAGRGTIGGALPPQYLGYAWTLMGTGATLPMTWSMSVAAAAALAAVWLLGAASLPRGPTRILLPLWVFAPPLLAQAASMAVGSRVMSPHHYVIFSIFAQVLAAAAVMRFWDRRQAVALALLALVVLPNLVALGFWWGDSRYHRGNWRAVAHFLARERRPGEPVVLQTGYCRFVYAYYVPEDPLAVDDVEDLEARAADWLGAHRVWLVENSAPATDPSHGVERRLTRWGTPGRQVVFPAFQGPEVVLLRPFEATGPAAPAVEPSMR